MVEGCFQDILSAEKQVEESAEDERRAQQTQKEKQRMAGNQDSTTGASKTKGSNKQTSNKSGTRKRKRGNRKVKSTESGPNTEVSKKPSWKSKKPKFSQEEQEQHKAMNLCFSCGKGGHQSKDCPTKVNDSKGKKDTTAVVKVIRTDGSNDLLNYGAIPDSTYDSSNRRILHPCHASTTSNEFKNSP